jgi:hypothetical protein
MWHDLSHGYNDRRTHEERGGRPPRGPERAQDRGAGGSFRGLVVGPDLGRPRRHPERRDPPPQLRRQRVSPHGRPAPASAGPHIGRERNTLCPFYGDPEVTFSPYVMFGTRTAKASSQDRSWPLAWVGVAGFEPAASSSRTTGAFLFAWYRCSVTRVRGSAHDGHRALRLLYPAAVPPMVCLTIHCQADLDRFDSRGHETAPSNLIGANGFAVGVRSLGRRGLCAVHATSGSTLDGVLSRRKNRRHRWTGHPH